MEPPKVTSYLPSKKMLRVLLIIGIVIIVGVCISYIRTRIVFNKTNEIKDTRIPAGTTVALGTLVETDTDNDGLADWEEPLWDMDPKNPDTNSNGISDGEEVASLRTSINASTATPNELAPEILSQTDTFTRELFSTIAALQENGKLTDESSASITAEIITFIKTKPTGKTYTISDIKSNANTSTNSSAYITGFGNALLKYPIKQEDFITLGSIVVTPDLTTPDANIQKIADKYHALVTTLLALPVPESEAATHLALINSINRTADMFADIAKYPIDPIPALASIYQSNDILTSLETNLNILQNDIYIAGGFGSQ